MSQAPLECGLQLQDLYCVMFIVFVAGLDNGPAPLCILNQVVPMLIVLETRREKQLYPKETLRCLGAGSSSFISEQMRHIHSRVGSQESGTSLGRAERKSKSIE